jgi:hypothetical protein
VQRVFAWDHKWEMHYRIHCGMVAGYTPGDGPVPLPTRRFKGPPGQYAKRRPCRIGVQCGSLLRNRLRFSGLSEGDLGRRLQDEALIETDLSLRIWVQKRRATTIHMPVTPPTLTLELAIQGESRPFYGRVTTLLHSKSRLTE